MFDPGAKAIGCIHLLGIGDRGINNQIHFPDAALQQLEKALSLHLGEPRKESHSLGRLWKTRAIHGTMAL